MAGSGRVPDDIRKHRKTAVEGLNAARPRSRTSDSTEAAAWRKENAEAIAGWNGWVERNGLPLAKYRS